MVELLVEVPTGVVVVVQLVEQTVDIPVLGARGVPGYGGLHGLLPGQSSSSSVEKIVHSPAPGRGVSAKSSRFSPWTRFGQADCGADR